MAEFKKYRRKPVIVEAVQWTVRHAPSDDAKPIVDLINSLGGQATFVYDYDDEMVYRPRIAIKTLEGTMYASVNDYICRGMIGEFWPVKPVVFEKTNEPAFEPATSLTVTGSSSISIQTDGDVEVFGSAK